MKSSKSLFLGLLALFSLWSGSLSGQASIEFEAVTDDFVTSLTSTGRPASEFGDVDDDGDLDLLLLFNLGNLNGNDTARKVRLYENDGSGTFSHVLDIDASQEGDQQFDGGVSGGGAVFFRDIDGDGKLDVLYTGEFEDPILYWNDSSGSGLQFSRVQDTPFPDAEHVSLGDIDNDGDLDAFCMGLTDSFPPSAWGEMRVNNGGRTFEESTEDWPGTLLGHSVLADMDADGHIDLLISGHWGGVLLLESRGDGTFFGGELMDVPGGGSGPTRIRPADVDGDGDLDLLVANQGMPATLYRNDTADGTVVFSEAASFVEAFFAGVAFGDVDNDGDLDLFLTGLSSDGHVSALYRNDTADGTIAFSEVEGVDIPPAVFATAIFGDVDGDWDMDLFTGGAVLESGPDEQRYKMSLHLNKLDPPEPPDPGPDPDPDPDGQFAVLPPLGGIRGVLAPNPSDGMVRVAWTAAGACRVSLHTLGGALVRSLVVPAGQSSVPLDVSDLVRGVYVVRLTVGQRTRYHRLVRR